MVGGDGALPRLQMPSSQVPQASELNCKCQRGKWPPVNLTLEAEGDGPPPTPSPGHLNHSIAPEATCSLSAEGTKCHQFGVLKKWV